MDFGILFGILGFAAVLFGWGIPLSKAAMFVHVPALAITLGGTLMAALVAFPFSRLRAMVSAVRRILLPVAFDPVTLIREIVGLAELSRREGILALEQRLTGIQDDFLSRGLQLAVDGADPVTVRDLLSCEIESMANRHRDAADLCETVGSFAPAFGMLGTLVGLVLMLSGMNDPGSIGPSMATALVTTFYGLLVANIVFVPLAVRMRSRSAGEVLYRNIALEGIAALQAGENPRVIERKLAAFLEPDLRVEIARRQASGGSNG